jgi:hypothetical protein
MTTNNHTIYRVDFNAVDPQTWNVLGDVDDAEGALSPEAGDYVLLVDPEGNRCYAWIERVDAGLLEFELDKSTWRSGDQQLTLPNLPVAAPRVA